MWILEETAFQAVGAACARGMRQGVLGVFEDQRESHLDWDTLRKGWIQGWDQTCREGTKSPISYDEGSEFFLNDIEH